MKQRIEGTAPGGAYSPGILAEGRFLFVSGQGPVQDGELVRGTIQDETRLTIANIGLVLEDAGLGFADGLLGGIKVEIDCVAVAPAAP